MAKLGFCKSWYAPIAISLKIPWSWSRAPKELCQIWKNIILYIKIFKKILFIEMSTLFSIFRKKKNNLSSVWDSTYLCRKIIEKEVLFSLWEKCYTYYNLCSEGHLVHRSEGTYKLHIYVMYASNWANLTINCGLCILHNDIHIQCHAIICE